jgi:hypothetical protein
MMQTTVTPVQTTYFQAYFPQLAGILGFIPLDTAPFYLFYMYIHSDFYIYLSLYTTPFY